MYDAKNADAIVKNNGMSGMTVGEAINKWRTNGTVKLTLWGETAQLMGWMVQAMTLLMK
ncbi:hypothetical protein [Acinetobacter baumannii]|uniref:hypothetical protein n=1 Tax=Acinetobacter baumannii TaxID=470 RepID=UPI00034D2254|nr:hypothetical protein [Acinetobacter baumannii]